MFPKAERFPVTATPETTDGERQQKQTQLRAARLDRRNKNKDLIEKWKRYCRKWSWVTPFLKACRRVQEIDDFTRRLVYKDFIPFEKLPRELIRGDSIRIGPVFNIWNFWRIQKIKERGSTSSVKLINKPELESKEETESIFSYNNLKKKLFGEGLSPTTVSKMQQGDLVQLPHVPIVMPMGDGDNRISNVASLPAFHGRTGSDPDWYMAQFLTACVANNGRTEEMWLRWFPATLKDVAIEWYNRQPTGYFANWNALRTAFLDHFRPVGLEDRIRAQLFTSKMSPGETVDAYFGRVTDMMRKWPNHNLPEPLVLSVIIAGLQPPELKMFVKEIRPQTWEETLNRAKIWEECHYDRYLVMDDTMIPSENYNSVAQRNTTNYNQSQIALPMGTDSRNMVWNVPPLQSRQPVSVGTVDPYSNQYPSMPPVQSNVVIPQNSNESVLLNLTKQMQVLATSLTKDKEKKKKGNIRNSNIFCTHCKGQGHLSTNCPSPNNMRVVCLNCGKEGHSIEDCWHLARNRQNGPKMMIPNTQYDVNQVQGGPRYGWNGQRQNGN